MAVLSFYKPIDGAKVGWTSGGQLAIPTVGFWAPATTYVASQIGTVVQSGNFTFRLASITTGITSAVGPSPTSLTDGGCTWALVGPVSNFAQSDAVQQQELGITCEGRDFSANNYGVAEFMYVKFTGTVVQGDAVQLDRYNFTASQTPTALASANSPIIVGISLGAQAAGTFGWAMIRGVCDIANITAGGTAGFVCSLGAAAGRLLSTGYVVNKTVDACVSKTIVPATNIGTVELYWPSVSGR